MSMYTGKLMFRKLSCGCVIECFTYPFYGLWKTELQDPGTTDEWFLGNLGTLRFM